MSAITSEPFGKTEDGQVVNIYTLTAGQVTVRVINIGCAIKDIILPDRAGNLVDVNLGYDTLEDYVANPAFLGCICGRVANRIAKGTFILDGVKVEVSKNDHLGNNSCHGGFIGFSRRYFDGKIDGSKLVFTYVDKDGAEGFPGDVIVTVTYELTEEAGLMMDYHATTTKATPVDIANRVLVNLAGHANGDISSDHVITINSSKKIELDNNFIPTGKFINTDGTVMDFRKATSLVDVIYKQPAGDGIHHALVLNGEKGQKKFVARADHPASGRFLEVHSTEPVVLASSAYYMAALCGDKSFKGGGKYQRNGGIVFMSQGYPDAVNHPEFPSCILGPGETYHTTTWYKFGATM